MSNTVHLIMFMGQSNMAGRGDAEQAPRVPAGIAYEFKSISQPDKLLPLCEPFGLGEDNPSGVFEPGMKSGSMVSAFCINYHRETGIPVVGVSCAKGGSCIGEWMPDGAYYRDAVGRMKTCERWLTENGCHIGGRYMAWCQGCTDGDLGTDSLVYKENTRTVLRSFMDECGIEACFLIQIGNHRDDPSLYVPMQQMQEELAEEEPSIVMVSRQFKQFAAMGLMRDRYHYKQEGYNLVGAEAGKNAGIYVAARGGSQSDNREVARA